MNNVCSDYHDYTWLSSMITCQNVITRYMLLSWSRKKTLSCILKADSKNNILFLLIIFWHLKHLFMAWIVKRIQWQKIYIEYCYEQKLLNSIKFPQIHINHVGYSFDIQWAFFLCLIFSTLWVWILAKSQQWITIPKLVKIISLDVFLLLKRLSTSVTPYIQPMEPTCK